MSVPDYRYGEERRQAVRLLRRIVRAYFLGSGPELTEDLMQRAREWLNEHDEMLPEEQSR